MLYCSGMNESELQAFLDRSMTAIVATVSAKSGVHSVLIWYRFKAGSRI